MRTSVSVEVAGGMRTASMCVVSVAVFERVCVCHALVSCLGCPYIASLYTRACASGDVGISARCECIVACVCVCEREYVCVAVGSLPPCVSTLSPAALQHSLPRYIHVGRGRVCTCCAYALRVPAGALLVQVGKCRVRRDCGILVIPAAVLLCWDSGSEPLGCRRRLCDCCGPIGCNRPPLSPTVFQSRNRLVCVYLCEPRHRSESAGDHFQYDSHHSSWWYDPCRRLLLHVWGGIGVNVDSGASAGDDTCDGPLLTSPRRRFRRHACMSLGTAVDWALSHPEHNKLIHILIGNTVRRQATAPAGVDMYVADPQWIPIFLRQCTEGRHGWHGPFARWAATMLNWRRPYLPFHAGVVEVELGIVVFGPPDHPLLAGSVRGYVYVDTVFGREGFTMELHIYNRAAATFDTLDPLGVRYGYRHNSEAGRVVNRGVG